MLCGPIVDPEERQRQRRSQIFVIVGGRFLTFIHPIVRVGRCRCIIYGCGRDHAIVVVILLLPFAVEFALNGGFFHGQSCRSGSLQDGLYFRFAKVVNVEDIIQGHGFHDLAFDSGVILGIGCRLPAKASELKDQNRG